MGKRQIHILPKDIAANKLFVDKAEDPTPLVGQEVNIHMTNLTVWHGYITGITDAEVLFKDPRLKKHTLKISDIKKLYADVVTDR
ncbi:MAG: hypothetical protein IAF08_09915 [Rhizobacter sp.]|nr:hypothetical protein [Chlorobiales bacterium]